MEKPGASPQSCFIYYLPHCPPWKGDGGTKKVLCTHGRCLHSFAWRVLFPLLRLIYVWSFLDFQKAVFAKYHINIIILFYSSWSTKEMQRCSGIVPLPLRGLLDTSSVPATAEDTGLLWTCDGELQRMAWHWAVFKAGCGDVAPVLLASAASFVTTSKDSEIKTTSLLLCYMAEVGRDSLN